MVEDNFLLPMWTRPTGDDWN